MSLAATHSRRRLLRNSLRDAKPRRKISAVFWLCLVTVLAAVGALVVVGLVWGIVWFGEFAGALPPPDQLTARSVFQTTRVLAGDGASELYEITDPQGGRRTIVTLDKVPRYLIEATIATEDPGFFSNPGFEVRSIVRAAFDDLTHQQIVSGASTITQQVVRNVLLSPDERADLSARRKLKEIVVAYQLTQTYTKEEILQVYLDEIFYGNRSYGIEAAAEGYFGKSAANLDLAESALLAGIPQQPGFYDPYRRPDDVKGRQAYVLQRMVDQGFTTADQAQEAASEELHFVDRRHAALAPHFVSYVSDQLETKLGTDQLYHGGDSAVTTLDVSLQSLAEDSVRSNLDAVRRTGANNAALVALDPSNGHILAMVGSANYDDPSIAGEVNMALAPRESGGILTPLTYSLVLQRGETLVSPIDDGKGGAPAPVGDQTSNSPPGTAPFARAVNIRDALGRGLQSAAVRAMALAGNQGFMALGESIGIADFSDRVTYGGNQTVVSARVSPLEVAQVYAMLAAGGVARPPVAIERVQDPTGHVLDEAAGTSRQAMDPGTAYLITSVLAEPAYRQDANDAALAGAKAVAERSAASEDGLDAWMAGYTSNLAVVVWVGNSNGRALASADAASVIWRDFMDHAVSVRPVGEFPVPSDVAVLSLCKNPACSARQAELVIQGTEKTAVAANAATIAVPSAVISNSRTPLVDRGQAPGAVATPTSLQPAAATARGPGSPVTVPDVSQTTPDQARQRLTAAGLAIAPLIQYQSSAELSASKRNVAVGQVVATSPPSGQQVTPGTSVVLIVRRN